MTTNPAIAHIHYGAHHPVDDRSRHVRDVSGPATGFGPWDTGDVL